MQYIPLSIYKGIRGEYLVPIVQSITLVVLFTCVYLSTRNCLERKAKVFLDASMLLLFSKLISCHAAR
jgi:hypothetical protein